MNPLSTLQRRLLYSALAVLLATGVYWALVHYVAGVRAWMGEPSLMKIHGAAAMVALVLIGGLMPAHVTLGWSLRRNRSSGTVLLVTCGLLAATGYLLYYLGGDTARQISSYIHLALGIALPFALGAHLVATSSRQPAAGFAASQPRTDPEDLAVCKTPKKAVLTQ